MNRQSLPVVVCDPCQYAAECCSTGVTLWQGERDAIEADHPGTTEWSDEEQLWHTRVAAAGCVFLQDGRCTIHGEAYYPDGCRRFPADYEFDNYDICPGMR